MANFWEAYKDPRWQKKRLEIMELAEFQCSYCGASDKTLNVHHGYYEKGKNPWEYGNGSLHCLCEECHIKQQKLKRHLNQAIGFLGSYERILGFALGLLLQNDEVPLVRHTDDVIDVEVLEGIAFAWRIPAGKITELICSLEEPFMTGTDLAHFHDLCSNQGMSSMENANVGRMDQDAQELGGRSSGDRNCCGA